MPLHLLLYVIAGLLLLAEAFTPGTFIFVCFSASTLAVALIDQVWGLTLMQVLALLLVFSLISLFTVRPLLSAIVKIPAEQDPRNFGSYVEKLIGREAMVFKAINTHELGVVKLYDFDETWLAKSEDGSEIGQGTTVKIKGIDGNHLIVAHNPQ